MTEVELLAENAALRNWLRLMVQAWQAQRAALRTIRDEYGHVCASFDTCDHAACRDSYAAWHVANEALQNEGG